MNSDSKHSIDITGTESVYLRGLIRQHLETISQPGHFVSSGVRERAIAADKDLWKRLTLAYLGDRDRYQNRVVERYLSQGEDHQTAYEWAAKETEAAFSSHI